MQHLSLNPLGGVADRPGLSDDIKTLIREALANMAKTPGFAPRRSQREMIAEIAKTLAGEYNPNERIICVEGPTGTGKSLGYLLSAIPVAKARGQKLVISTATVALQEQLINKDLPSVLHQAGIVFTYALAKGRRRYVCDRNLEQLVGAEDQQELDLDEIDIDPTAATWSVKPLPEELETVKAMWEAREKSTWNGDLDDWKAELRSEFKMALTTDRAGCTGKGCPFYEQCAFLNASAQRKKADVIVANHALVLADLAMGGGAVLPDPEETIYVFDEGHHLPDVAIEQNAARSHLLGPQKALTNLTTIPDAVRRTVPNRPDVHEVMNELELAFKVEVKMLKERLAELFEAIKDVHPAMQRPEGFDPYSKRRDTKANELAVWRFERGLVPNGLRERFRAAWHASDVVFQRTKKLVEAIKKPLEDGEGSSVTGMALASAQSLHDRLEAMRNTFSLFSRDPEKPSAPPVARWIEAVNDGKDFECCANPTSAADMLRSLLWSQCKGAVLTSATLAALGRFDRLFEQTGLGPKYGTQAVRLASPFDYRRKAELVIPSMSTSAKNADAHTAEIIEMMNTGLINPSEGTLVLFASYKQMNAVAKGLNFELADRVLMQGAGPRSALLAEHRERIAAGEGSILFGVASFAEGLDLPGKLCTHVIIAKLFFAVPDSPVEKTRSEWLESLGRNPFIEISVPDASFKLIQAAGRLLRTETDSGRVTVLDRRLVETRYGREMLAALPPFKRTIGRSRWAA